MSIYIEITTWFTCGFINNTSSVTFTSACTHIVYFCVWVSAELSIDKVFLCQALLSRSSSSWDFHFHSYLLTIYVRLYWILELVVFYSRVCRGYIFKVSVQLVRKYFSRVCGIDSISCSERKSWKKRRLKYGRKTKEGKSKHCCRCQSTWLIIAILSNRYCSVVAPISLRCRSVLAPLPQRYRTATVPLPLRRCCSFVALLSHRYRTGIAPLLLRCCRSCCRYAVAPLSHRCRTVVEPWSLRPRKGIHNSILNWCCSTVIPLSLLLSIVRFTRLSPQEA